MSVQTKLIIGFVALVAFGVGIAFNTTRVSSIDLDSSALLQAKLETTEGTDSVENLLGELTLVNFWATWCAPCREEMPIFEMMYRGAKQDGFQVIGVAIDNPEAAQPMLDSMGITYPILYAEQTGMEVMELSGNPEGLLPYSLLLNQQGQVIDQVLGRIDEQQIAQWLGTHLQPNSK
jgi:thiol-disulfide isomerase/thioredoxin